MSHSNIVIALLILASSGLTYNVAGPSESGGRISSAPAAAAPDTIEPIDLDYSPPASVRKWYYNHGNTGDPSGDCVQVSIGIDAVRCNNFPAAVICWDTPLGPAIRGGSGPSRVAEYCRQRGIKVYNVTGSRIEDTYQWACYAVRTGRGAAIGFGRGHFQTLMGFDRVKNKWLVCDNNSPQRVDEYTDEEFRALHAASGFWIVVLDGPAPPPPITTILEPVKPLSFWEQLFGGADE
jgi:hypothetical protein